jgi:hypothetical protein
MPQTAAQIAANKKRSEWARSRKGPDGRFLSPESGISPVPPRPRAPIDPPLVSLSVTNPITYIKKWWKSLVHNEGVDIRFRIRPLTALLISLGFAIVLFGGGYSFGVLNSYLPVPIPLISLAPTINPIREVGYTGIIRRTQENYFIEIGNGEMILVNSKDMTDIEKFVGKRVLTSGTLDTTSNIYTPKDLSEIP